VPDDVGLAAYRIVREALTNVLKHAGNARATVNLDFTGGVEITVTDDGRGAAAHLDGPSPSRVPLANLSQRGPGRCCGQQRGLPGGGRAGAGRGITGMAERAAAAGAMLTAGPRLGGGFEVHALMPLADR